MQDFTDDAVFIAWSLACMEGPLVNPWRNALLYRRAEILAAGQALPPVLEDWDDFKAEFSAKFADSNKAENARRALMALRQTCSAREFMQEFDRLAEITGLTGQGFLLNQFRRSLKHNVQEKLLWQHFPDLHDLQNAAIEWDNILFQFRKQQRAFEQRKPLPKPQLKPQSEGVPMDLDYTKLSAEETKKCREAGACFRCNRPGHIGRNCPTNRNRKGQSSEPRKWTPKIAAMERPLSPVSEEETYVTDHESSAPDFHKD